MKPRRYSPPVPLTADMTPDEWKAAFKDSSITFEHKIQEDLLDLFPAPRQLLDIKLRSVSMEDLKRIVSSVPVDIKNNELIAAVEGGLTGIELTFLESSLLHAVLEAFSNAKYPDKITLTRSQLYELMGVEKTMGSDGYARWVDGGPAWMLRKKYHKGLHGLGDKRWPIFYLARTGLNKKGKPIFGSKTHSLTSLISVEDVHLNIEEEELPGFVKGDPAIREGRFSHYVIKLHNAAKGEVDHYFRYIPSGLGRMIANYRKSRGQRASVSEFNFCEYLYATAQETIEINVLKLAQKIKLKSALTKEPTRAERRARKVLRRCYETALALNLALEIKENQPALRGATKEVIRLNPQKFKYMGQKRLFASEDNE